jgi:hypothetical protein
MVDLLLIGAQLLDAVVGAGTMASASTQGYRYPVSGRRLDAVK